MKKNTTLKKITCTFYILYLITYAFFFAKIDTKAVSFPNFNVSFDATSESVIVDGIPASSSDGSIEYQLEGYLNYENERVETFCYAPNVRAYDVPDKRAYIFNWSGDAEFLLPCTGEYYFTAYITARYQDAQGNMTETSGPKTTISITLHKQDESTNWGPGLPNTTVEIYDLNQIKGKNKTIIIEEAEYTWTINGNDIENVPAENLSLKVTANPDSFPNEGVDDFFGDTIVLKLNLEHNGEFGFNAILDYKIGNTYTQKYANLFHVVGDGTFEYIGGDIIDENGVASFSFTHASDYILAITDTEYTGQQLNTKVEEDIADSSTEAETEDTTTDESIASDESTDINVENASIEETATEPEPQAESSDIPTVVDENTTNNTDIWFVIGGIVLIAVIIVVILCVKKNTKQSRRE